MSDALLSSEKFLLNDDIPTDCWALAIEIASFEMIWDDADALDDITLIVSCWCSRLDDVDDDEKRVEMFVVEAFCKLNAEVRADWSDKKPETITIFDLNIIMEMSSEAKQEKSDEK